MISLFLLSLLFTGISCGHNEIDVATYICNYVKKHEHLSGIVIFMNRKHISKYSSTVKNLMESIQSQASTNLIDIQDLRRNLTDTDRWYHLSIMYNSLNVLIIDSAHGKYDLMIEVYIAMYLLSHLNLNERIHSSRYKYFIIYVNYKNSYEPSYYKLTLNKLLWYDRYLNVTIIEIFTKSKYHEALIQPDTNVDIFVHQSNPFNDTYTCENFHPDIQILNNKLRNLYGMTLDTGFYCWSEMSCHGLIINGNYTGKNIMGAVSGSAMKIINIIADKLNFTMNLTVVDCRIQRLSRSLGPLIKRFNLTCGQYFIGMNNFDFYLNPFMYTNYFFVTCSNVMHLYTARIVVRQDVYQEIPIYDNLVKLSLLAVVFISLIVATRFMDYDREIWSIFNVIRILMGIPLMKIPRILPQRLLFLFIITIIPTIFMEQLLQFLLEFCYPQTTSRRMETFQDLIDSNTTVTKINNEDLFLKIADGVRDRPETHIFADYKRKFMYEKLFNGTLSSLMLRDYEAAFLKEASLKIANNWTLTVLKEPAGVVYVMLLHNYNSPYIYPFYYIMLRLQESGIINMIMNNDMKNDVKHLRKSFESNEESVVPTHISSGQILICLGIGYLLSCVCFIFEIVWDKAQKLFK